MTLPATSVALAAAHDGDAAALTLLIGPDVQAEVTETSLTLPEGLSFVEYERVGRLLGRVNRSCSWWVGDYLAYGEDEYDEAMAQAEAATGLSAGTLQNRASVCRAIPPEQRIPGLSFSAHVTVAGLEPDVRALILDSARTTGATVEAIRERVREHTGREALPSVRDLARHVVIASRLEGDEYHVPRGALEDLGRRLRILDGDE